MDQPNNVNQYILGKRVMDLETPLYHSLSFLQKLNWRLSVVLWEEILN